MNERPRPTVVIPAHATPVERHQLIMLHAFAALGEGICPSCAGDLQPTEGDSHSEPTGRTWTRCRTCACYWQTHPERQEWTREEWWSWEGITLG